MTDFSEANTDNSKFHLAISKINGVVVVLDSMDEQDRISLLEALYDDSMDAKSIHSILVKNGWDVSYDQVRRFRNGSCRIPDDYKQFGEN